MDKEELILTTLLKLERDVGCIKTSVEELRDHVDKQNGRVADLEKTKWKSIGIASALTFIIGLVASWFGLNKN